MTISPEIYERPHRGRAERSVCIRRETRLGFAVLPCLALALAACAEGSARTSNERSALTADALRCGSELKMDLRIRICTGFIQSGAYAERDLAWLLNGRGLGYGAQGRFDLAIEDLTAAIDLDPAAAEVLGNRGVIYILSGRPDLAVPDLEASIRLKPDYADAYNYRGLIFLTRGEYDRAIQDFDTAIRLKPDYGDALGHRGFAHLNSGDPRLALEDFNRALQVRHSDASPRLGRAVALERLGETAAAERDYADVRAVDPNLEAGLRKLGILPGPGDPESQ